MIANETIRAASAALLIALPTSLARAEQSAPAAPAQTQAAHADHSGSMSPASTAYMEAMTAMDEAMAGMTMTGRPDVDFTSMMIPHHRSAIDMAKAYLASGDDDPVLAKMAEDILASQAGEIAAFERWLAENGAK